MLQEYFVASTGKLGVEPRLARRKAELFARLDLQIVDLEDGSRRPTCASFTGSRSGML